MYSKTVELGPRRAVHMTQMDPPVDEGDDPEGAPNPPIGDAVQPSHPPAESQSRPFVGQSGTGLQ
eukprot:6663684-Lingulodinium_polyedra.AAC.1